MVWLLSSKFIICMSPRSVEPSDVWYKEGWFQENKMCIKRPLETHSCLITDHPLAVLLPLILLSLRLLLKWSWKQMCALYFWKSRLIIKEGGLIRSYGLMEFSSNSSPHVPSPVPIPITNSHNHHANLHPSQPKSTFINPTFPTPFASIGNSIRLLPPSLSPPKSRVFSLSLVRKLLKHRWLHGRHTKVTMDSKKSGSKPRKMCSKRSLLRLSNWCMVVVTFRSIPRYWMLIVFFFNVKPR